MTSVKQQLALRLALLVAVTWLVTEVRADDCTGTSCSTCVAAQGCGWCDTTSKCLAGGITVAENICPSANWFWASCRVSADGAQFIGLYVGLGLGIPAIIGLIVLWFWWQRRKIRQQKNSRRTAFADGLTQISNKYKNMLKGKEERLLTADTVRSNSTRR